MTTEAVVPGVDELAALIEDGASLAIPPDYSNVPLAATAALIRRNSRNLNLVAVPTSGLQTDLLIGAGCVASLEAAAVSLGEFGPAPRFTDAIRRGALAMKDSTCPAIHAALQAAEKGVPFMPLRGVIGSDLIGRRPDWRVIDSPFGENDPILLLPALRPDVALFHARRADRSGNVWLGRRRELVTMAHAARRCLVTVEEIVDDDFLADEITAAGTLPSLYVEAIALAPGGAQPLGLEGVYEADRAMLADYAEMARSADGFARWLDRFLTTKAAAA
jgi:glutaconate CoA-transferase, subunit A